MKINHNLLPLSIIILVMDQNSIYKKYNVNCLKYALKLLLSIIAEVLGYTYEVSLNTNSQDYFETKTESIGYSSCTYNNKTYVFQTNGIYELEGLRQSREYESSGSKPSLSKVTSWTLNRGERVLSVSSDFR